MNKKLKRDLLIGAAALMFASVGLSSTPMCANASNYMSSAEERAERGRYYRITRPKRANKMTGHVFATMSTIGHKYLYKGESVKVAPFYHMGKDGYVVHVPGNSSTYYVPTNSHNWFSSRRKRKSNRNAVPSNMKGTWQATGHLSHGVLFNLYSSNIDVVNVYNNINHVLITSYSDKDHIKRISHNRFYYYDKGSHNRITFWKSGKYIRAIYQSKSGHKRYYKAHHIHNIY